MKLNVDSIQYLKQSHYKSKTSKISMNNSLLSHILKQQRQTKDKMKQQVATITAELDSLQRDARGDQKFIIRQLKQQLTKQIERHKHILRDMVKQSFANQFDRLSLKESMAMGANSNQDHYFIQPPNNAEPSRHSIKTESQQELSNLSIQQPLLDSQLDIEHVAKQSPSGSSNSQDRDTQDIEALQAKAMNEQILLEQQKVVQSQLDKYDKELDSLIDLHRNEDKANCQRIAIISVSVIVLLITLVFATLYFVL